MSGDVPAPEQEQSPQLPVNFYEALLKRPACKMGKPCDGCGQCEH